MTQRFHYCTARCATTTRETASIRARREWVFPNHTCDLCRCSAARHDSTVKAFLACGCSNPIEAHDTQLPISIYIIQNNQSITPAPPHNRLHNTKSFPDKPCSKLPGARRGAPPARPATQRSLGTTRNHQTRLEGSTSFMRLLHSTQLLRPMGKGRCDALRCPRQQRCGGEPKSDDDQQRRSGRVESVEAFAEMRGCETEVGKSLMLLAGMAKLGAG